MSTPPILGDALVEIRESIATITLNRPEQRNPLSASMMRDLRAALAWCKAERAIAVVVLTGGGDRAFCAGADLAGFADRHDLVLVVQELDVGDGNGRPTVAVKPVPVLGLSVSTGEVSDRP